MFNHYLPHTVLKPLETIQDTETLERIKDMFKSYSLDDALDFSIFPGSEWIAFERNGSIYTLCYFNNKLKYVTVVPT